MTKRLSLRRTISIGVFLFVTTSALANIPPGLTSFQGVLRDASNLPLNGNYSIVFRYWSDPTSVVAAVNEIGWETHPVVTVNDGLFTVLLGSQPFSNGASGYSGLNIIQMFGDFEAVYLQLEVDGDVLLPRIRFAAAPYAFNCTQLQDKAPGEFLRSEGSDNFTGSALYGFTMTYDPATTLNVAGVLQLAGATVASSADELNRLDGVAASVTAANLSTLTNGGNANALHQHTNVNATLLDGIDSGQFLRSDASDSFTAGTLTFVDGTVVSVSGDLVVNAGDTTPRIYFQTGALPRPELKMHMHGAGVEDDRFEFTDSLSIDGLFHAGPLAGQAARRTYHYFGDYLQPGSTSGYITDSDDLLVIGDLAANGRVFASDQLHVASGNSAARNYSAFGSGAPMSSDMTSGDDLHVTSDLEVGGSLYAISGLIAGDVSPTTGQIFSSIGEASGQDWSEINGTSDLYVAQDLEVDGTLNVHLIVSPASSNISIEAEADARTMIDTNVSGANVASWFHDGVYSNANKVAEIQEDGDLRIRGALSESVAFDIAENFWATEPIAAGELVAADPILPGAVRRATIHDAGRVLGVASRRPGIVLGGAPFDEAALAASWGEAVHARFQAESESLLAELQTRHPEHALEPPDEAVIESLALELFAEKHFVPLALAGRVRLHVDASARPIAVGDPLGPGPLPGIAVAVQGKGPIVAIALEPLASGRSQILAFIQRGGIVASTPHGEPTMESEAGAQQRADASPFSPVVLDRGTAPISPTTGLARTADLPFHGYVVLDAVEAGDLLVSDPTLPDQLRRAASLADPGVVGVALGEPGTQYLAGAVVPVAESGIARCRVDATGGVILRGDLLVTGAHPGSAVRQAAPNPGTIVGKALEPHHHGVGWIRVLVAPR
jgi:hypothetical protein